MLNQSLASISTIKARHIDNTEEKRMLKRLLILIPLLFVSSTCLAFPQQELVPGGIAMLRLTQFEPGTKVYFDNRRVAVYPYQDGWVALAGIGLSSKPGDHEFAIKHADGLTVRSKVTVNSKKYKEQHLTIKNKRKVNPNAEDTKRIIAEKKRKNAAKSKFSETTPKVDFIWPVTGRISSIFGLRRFFNDQERNPHNGLDIAADEGTPIKATADGTVIDAGNFFFSGNMVYLDHGQGIISLYAHMSEINVKPGDTVKQGDIIGKVGQTGRVTGPHLHFAVFANKTLIDPLFMLPKDGNQMATETHN